MAVSRQGANRKSAKAGAKARGKRRSSDTDPRANQRRRTKAAIMEGARKLLLAGKVPSVADAAEEAGVSRATAYRYFPTQGTLVREAVDEVLVRNWEWDELLADPGGHPEPIEHYVSVVFGLMRENEALMRGALLTALDQWARVQAGEDLGEEPIKRGGRLDGIKAALKSYDGELDPEAKRRLSVALSLVVGIEAHVVYRDIWGLDDDEAEEISLWMARVLTKAALQESRRRR
jgi:AcrR family transcriptional regulator